jgi:hypothetical protein
MSEGVDDTSARQGGTSDEPARGMGARGQDRQAAKRADEARARDAAAASEEVRPASEEIRRADDQAASAFFRRRRSKSAMSSLRVSAATRSIGWWASGCAERRSGARRIASGCGDGRGPSEQKRASIRRWHEAHPEKTAEYSRRYYERHREEILARGARGATGILRR